MTRTVHTVLKNLKKQHLWKIHKKISAFLDFRRQLRKKKIILENFVNTNKSYDMSEKRHFIKRFGVNQNLISNQIIFRIKKYVTT